LTSWNRWATKDYCMDWVNWWIAAWKNLCKLKWKAKPSACWNFIWNSRFC